MRVGRNFLWGTTSRRRPAHALLPLYVLRHDPAQRLTVLPSLVLISVLILIHGVQWQFLRHIERTRTDGEEDGVVDVCARGSAAVEGWVKGRVGEGRDGGRQAGGGGETGRREEEAHGREAHGGGGGGERRRDAARPPCLGSAGSRPRGRFPAWWLAVGPPLVCCARRRRRCRPCHYVCRVVSFAARLPRNLVHAVLCAVSFLALLIIVWFRGVMVAVGGVPVVGVCAVCAPGSALWPWSRLGAAPGPPGVCRELQLRCLAMCCVVV